MSLWFYIRAIFTVAMALIDIIMTAVVILAMQIIKNTIGRVFPKLNTYCTWLPLHVWQTLYMAFAPTTKYIISGDILSLRSDKRRSILLFNHQTFFDWGFIWTFMKFFGCDDSTCIILKKSLRNIPILGWVMEKAGFCFLDRDWKKDQSNIDIFWNSCFSDTATHRMLIMFPEGTTRDVNSLKRSCDWAAKTNRPQLQYLLLPRSTGLFALVKRLREDDAAKDYESYICDCTMQYSTYSGEVPDSSGENRQHDVGVPEIKSFLCPSRVYECHIHYSKTPIVEIVPESVTDDEEMHRCVEKWLDERWVEKEREMQHFIDHGEFSDEWCENRVTYEYSLSMCVRDTIYWMVPIALCSLLLRFLRIAGSFVFGLLLRVPIIAKVYAAAVANLFITVPAIILISGSLLALFYKKTIYSTR
ncbi:hypothetical protein WA538_005402, partial [Blastocystis sp. DL]